MKIRPNTTLKEADELLVNLLTDEALSSGKKKQKIRENIQKLLSFIFETFDNDYHALVVVAVHSKKDSALEKRALETLNKLKTIPTTEEKKHVR